MDNGIGNERPRKLMPSITTYTSDDSFDEDDDLSASQESETKSPTPKSEMSSKSNPPDSPPSSSNSDDEEVFNSLAEKLSNLPVSELIASEDFVKARKRISRNRKYRLKSWTRSFALFFDELKTTMKEKHPKASFGEIVRLIAEQWDQLPMEKKQEYQRCASSILPDDNQSLLSYKTRLLNLNPGQQRICSNPSCAQPVVMDPRWNGQYCSTACVSEHCRVAFTNWCAKQRVVPTPVASPFVGFNEAPVAGDADRNCNISAPAVKEPVSSLVISNSSNVTLNQERIKPEPASPLKSSPEVSKLGAIAIKKEEADNVQEMGRKSLFESFRGPTLSLISSKSVINSAPTR